jgi:hypothetical protein
MDTPREFHDFCRRFHQDVFLINPRLEDTIEAALKSFDGRQRKVLEEFVSSLLSSNISDAELIDLWSRAGADFYLRGARHFFGEILNQLATGRTSE